ncbi:MAG: metalloregulator ArsR/SmtB family transcription factor [Pseudomonadota bacterium]
MSTSPKAALLSEYALVAQALSAPARLTILEQLVQRERGVDALADRTGLTIANCSQHLQQLRHAGLVASRRDVKAMIYRLPDTKTLALMDLMAAIAGRNLGRVAHILRGLPMSRSSCSTCGRRMNMPPRTFPVPSTRRWPTWIRSPCPGPGG